MKILGQHHWHHRMKALWLTLLMLVTLASVLPAQGKPTGQAYLYLDAYGARFECLLGVSDLMELLGKPTPATLQPGVQQEILGAAQARAQKWLQIKLDGKPASVALSSVSLVKGKPGMTDRPVPGEELAASQTMVGFTWELDLESIPQSIEITWGGFSGAWTVLPVTVIVRPPGEDFELTAKAPSHAWNNQGRLNLRTPLAEVPPSPSPSQVKIPVASAVWLALGTVFMSLRRRSRVRPRGGFVRNWIMVIVGAAIVWPLPKLAVNLLQNENVPPEQAEKILQSLLRNTYRAFDQRSESAIYDLLERSIDGELLQRVYLQTIEALSLDAQDKTRVRVTDLVVQVSATQPRKSGAGFVADVRWTALGTVGHWGHEHTRVNRYIAKVTVAPIAEKQPSIGSTQAAWKMVDLEIQEEKRL